MLPKQYRLQDYQEVEKVKKEGKLYQTPLFGLLVLSRAEGLVLNTSAKLGVNPVERLSSRFSFPRFAFIISTKISKKATQRNRAKRVLSEAVRGLLPKLKFSFDAVFLGKKSLIGKSFSEIQAEVEKVFRKSGLMG